MRWGIVIVHLIYATIALPPNRAPPIDIAAAAAAADGAPEPPKLIERTTRRCDIRSDVRTKLALPFVNATANARRARDKNPFRVNSPVKPRSTTKSAIALIQSNAALLHPPYAENAN